MFRGGFGGLVEMGWGGAWMALSQVDMLMTVMAKVLGGRKDEWMDWPPFARAGEAVTD
jgi:hypothetical protein